MAGDLAVDDGSALATRVALAQSKLQELVDKAYREKLQPHMDAFAADEISAAELTKRKKAARKEAEEEHGGNRKKAVDDAFAAYEVAKTQFETAKAQLEAQLEALAAAEN